MSRKRKLIFGVVGLVLAGFIILQIIPIGSIRSVLARVPNPPITQTIAWDSAETEEMVRAACYDCHSNETVYPWYSNIAPVSWLVSRDINKGREAMNFSENAPTDYDLEDLGWHLNNDMPPDIYLVMHPEAALTADEKALLLEGFQATLTEASHEGMDMGS